MEIKQEIIDSNITLFEAWINGNNVGECRVHNGNAICYLNNHMKIMRPFINNNFEGRRIYIANLDVNSEYRGKYIGTRLLYHVLNHFYRNGYRTVTLIDASDRSGEVNSIYKQIGFAYSGEYTHNLIGNIRHILFGKFRGKNGRNRNGRVFYRKKRIVSPI